MPGQLGEGVLARSHVAIWTPPLKNQQFRVGALPTSSPRPPCRTHGRSELQQAETHALSCTHQHLHARGMQAAGTQLARTRVPALECQARVQRRPLHVLSAHAQGQIEWCSSAPTLYFATPAWFVETPT